MSECKYTVIRDTREKPSSGWLWNESKFCTGTLFRTLKTGDYTIEGYEDYICIERKGTVTELATNLMSDRFYRELERMSQYRHKFIICEFPFSDVSNYPNNSDIPIHVQDKIKLSSAYLIRLISEVQLKYNIPIIFAGNKNDAWLMVSSLFKRLNEGVTPYKG